MTLLKKDFNFELGFDPRRLHATLSFDWKNALGPYKDTPLESSADLACEMIRLAIKHGRKDVILQILTGSPNVLTSYSCTKTILQGIMSYGSGEVLDLLVDAGLEVSGRLDGLLHIAEFERNFEMVETLLRHGANPPPPRSADEFEPQSLEGALNHSEREFERALDLSPSPIPLREIPILLSKATIYYSLSTIEKLITSCMSKNNMTISDVFAVWGDSAPAGVLFVLQRFGRDWLYWLRANKASFDLFSAYFQGDHLLLTRRFMLNVLKDLRHIPLSWSELASGTAVASIADTAALHTLLDFGVSPDLGLLKLCLSSCDRDGQGSMERAHLILERRATLQLKTSCQDLITVFSSVAERLHAHHGKGYPSPRYEDSHCRYNHLAALEFLVKQGMTVESVWQIKLWQNNNSINYELAYLTILSGNPWDAAIDSGYAAVERLVQSGANVNDEFLENLLWTRPLLVALGRREPKIAELLISKGADVNVFLKGPSFCCGELTPLQMAADAGYFPIVLILLQAGAIVDTPRR